MSTLIHQLRKTVGQHVGSGKAGFDSSKQYSWDQEKYAGLEINEYLKRRNEDGKRFERDFSVMIGCVSPRSLSARFEITSKNLKIEIKMSKHHIPYNMVNISLQE